MSGAAPSRLGKYEVRATLGKGAMGVVFDGWDPVIDRRVAIKTVRLPDAHDEEAVEGLARFKREAQAAGRLQHPNIVGVFDYGETDEVAFIVMEFVEGPSLKDMLNRGERMSAATAVALTQDVLAGLAYSHGRGVVHRDIKPANIMLTAGNRAKIADFGIARIESSSMTQAGTVMGTPAYMSPEQFMGQVVDRRTDIYSCGVMLYQLLTGERPYEGSMTSIMHKAMTTTPPPPSALAVTSPAILDPVVARAMARRAEDRYPTADAFAADLAAPGPLAAEEPASDRTIIATRPAPAPVTAGPRPRSRAPLLAGAAALAALVLAGGGWAFLRSGHEATPPVVVASDQRATPPVEPPRTVPVEPPHTVPVEPPRTGSAEPPRVATAEPRGQPPADTSPASASPSPPGAQVVPPAPDRTPPAVQPVEPPRVPVSVTPPAGTLPAATTSQPGPGEKPARSAALVLQALVGRLPNVGCSLVQASVGADGAAALTGAVGAGGPQEVLRQAVSAAEPASVATEPQAFTAPYCPVLDVLRRARGPAALALGQPGGPASLADNDLIALDAVVPFGGYLQVAYLENDGTVSQLVPGPGYPRGVTTAAAATVLLGRPRGDFPGWHVGPPFGSDLIVAIVSTTALFDKPPPDGQPIADYAKALAAATDSLRRNGGSFAASAVVLDTRPSQ